MTRNAASRRVGRSRGSRGFTYVGLLFAVVVLGLALSTAGTIWSAVAQREREAQLLWVGEQYIRAIEGYYLHAPGGNRRYPHSLEDLVEDNRGPVVRRHLRQVFPDPTTGKADWELEQLADGAIVGLHSRSGQRPLRRAGWGPGTIDFAKAERYSDWVFVYSPRMPPRPRQTPP